MVVGNSDRLCSRNGPNGGGVHYELACSVPRSGQHGPSCKLERLLSIVSGPGTQLQGGYI